MKEIVTLAMVDEEPTFILQDGSIIDTKLVGYIRSGYDGSIENTFFDRITKDDIKFIMNNNIELEIEMMDEFTNPENYDDVPLFEGERKPKLHKGKIIINLK
jgi:hypothetical protein